MTERRRRQSKTKDEPPDWIDAQDPSMRTLPHNLEAERSVLGAILVHNDAYERVNDIIKPIHFYRDGHRRIYEAIERLFVRRVVVDFVTIREELTRTNELDDAGGISYIASLADGVPRATNAKGYAAIMREKAMLRDIIFASNKVLSLAYEAEEKAELVLSTADRAFLDIKMHVDRGRMASLQATMKATFERIEYRHEHRHELLGVDTGFQALNDELLGWQPGELNILAARPSIGKTAFFMNAIVLAAQGTQRTRTAVFSLEMRRAQLENRILAMLSGVDAHRIRSGHIGSKDFEALGPALATMADLPIWIDDRAGQNAIEMRATCRRLKAEESINLVVIDYVQLMAHCLTDRRGANKNEEVTDTANRLKDLSDELNLPIVLVSQLTRANQKRDDPRPKMSDLRESGALEQVADVVAFLHRKNHREGGYTEFIIEKQRNGPTGTVDLDFNRDTQRFVEWVGPKPVEKAKTVKATVKVEPPDVRLPLPIEPD